MRSARAPKTLVRTSASHLPWLGSRSRSTRNRFGSVGFDDPEYLTGSIHLQNELSIEGLKWAFTTPALSNYIPLTFASHMLDRTLFGDDLGKYHLTNVALHALSSVLLFFALLSMTGALWRSATVAMLFAVHPLNVESVAENRNHLFIVAKKV